MAKEKNVEVKVEASYLELKEQIETLNLELEKAKKEIHTRTLEKNQAELELARVKCDPLQSKAGLDKLLEECYKALYYAKSVLKSGSGQEIKAKYMPTFHKLLGISVCEQLERDVLGLGKPKK